MSAAKFTRQDLELLVDCLFDVLEPLSGPDTEDRITSTTEEVKAHKKQIEAAIAMTKRGTRIGAFGLLEPR